MYTRILSSQESKKVFLEVQFKTKVLKKCYHFSIGLFRPLFRPFQNPKIFQIMKFLPWNPLFSLILHFDYLFIIFSIKKKKGKFMFQITIRNTNASHFKILKHTILKEIITWLQIDIWEPLGLVRSFLPILI